MPDSNIRNGYPIGLEWEEILKAHSHPPKSRPLSGAGYSYYRRPIEQAADSSRRPPHLGGSERRIANPRLLARPLS